MSDVSTAPAFARQVRPGARVRRVDPRRGGRVDLPLVAATLALCLAGTFFVYAATRNQLLLRGADPLYYVKREGLNIVVGTGLALLVYLFDYRALRGYVPLLYGGACLSLLAVLSPLGTVVNGARAWFTFGAFQLEPSEFLKIVLIVFLAGALTARAEDRIRPGARRILLLLVLAGVPLLLVLAEPALGNAIIIAALAVGLLAMSDAPARWTVGLLLMAVLAGGAAFHLHLLKPYQEKRFTAFTDLSADASGPGYHTYQGLLAISSGGMTGKGLLGGTQTNGGFVPEQQTDFVFTVAGEETGLLGCGLLLAAFGVVFLRGLRIARRAADPFGRLVAAGVVIWLSLQAFVNIGMTLGITPVTGLPLPFVSYGGSAMFADLIAVGLLCNVARRSGGRAASS